GHETEPSAGVAPQANGRAFTVVSLFRSPPVTIVKGRARAVPEDRTQLKTGDDAPPQSAARLLGRVQHAAHRQDVALVVVAAAALVAQIEVVLRREEERVARVVNRFRESVRQPPPRPPPEPPVR